MKYDDEDWFNSNQRFRGTILLWKIILIVLVIFTIVKLIERYC